MANTVTAAAALAIRSNNWSGPIPAVVSMDTVQSAKEVRAAVTGSMIGVVNGALQNNHASGAQTVIFRSATTEVQRKKLAAADVWNLGDPNGGFSKAPTIVTQPGEALNLYLNDATNQPIAGTVYTVTASQFLVI